VKEEKRRKLVALAAQNQTANCQQSQFLPLIDPKSKFSKQQGYQQSQVAGG